MKLALHGGPWDGAVVNLPDNIELGYQYQVDGAKYIYSDGDILKYDKETA